MGDDEIELKLEVKGASKLKFEVKGTKSDVLDQAIKALTAFKNASGIR